MAEAIPYLGLDIEDRSGDRLRVEYSPNRPDYSTDYGIAMGLQGLLGVRRGMAQLRIRDGKYSIKADTSVSKIRPYVTCIAAKGRDVDDSLLKQLISMQEDLHAGLGRGAERPP
ncbi:phenylalanyl-tRNA synthetase beta subunit [Cenarchaeum symbiosum A]|uniref:Phenylalanyl-tRNA synthetase beta subunit n=1 Tax=Cenarchaeum symbiosum (strain A) TaxID=414004 RepID=A0RTQ6_CENSY|nr:phenylalanyl-tRNA synthetase beta subunit [Cenarchaeum symbiosum A]